MATDEAIAREAFETAATIMVVLDADGVVRRINDRGCQVLGYDRSELEGAEWFETIVPDGSDVGLTEVLDRVRSGEESDVHENTVRTSEGEIRWIKWHVAGLRDDDGTVTDLLVSGSDVTDRVETERRLRRYEQAIESSTNLLAAIDQDYTYVLTNRRYREFYGIEGASADDRSVADVLDPEQFAEVKPYIDRALDGESLEYETERVDRDGNERTFHVQYFPLEAENDTIQGAVAALQDVTDRKERSKQLRREVERLEEFASVISHDLRNPLNVAQGRLALLSEEIDSDHIEPIDRSLERMEVIIEDTLTLARQGKTVGETESVAVADVIGQCWVSVATGEAALSFDERFTIWADRDRLRHVFENLFRNAVTHGGPNVTVRIGRTDGGFYVEDDGPGIPDGDRESIFEPGYTTVESGTGFGLTIVRGIAEAHGWTVTATAGTEGGARFEFDDVDIVA
ncbi:sensor histidine kinase [Halorhabdus amylolytica]|uniref:sensor histidine kinase n=1 Tax=Halorhabdus amylolytica TaxID=2559573 RepID=UPI0010AAD962|nr:PAS domain-containing sensor histidine kinase [Halorhabdus amylolytica]